MIQSEIINNETTIHQWSDEGKRLLQVETGLIYPIDVYDVFPCPYTYKEVEESKEDIDEISAEELKSMIEEVL